MDLRNGHSRSSSEQRSHHLPGFDQFVLHAGRPELACRPPSYGEYCASQAAYRPPVLLTPPATNRPSFTDEHSPRFYGSQYVPVCESSISPEDAQGVNDLRKASLTSQNGRGGELWPGRAYSSSTYEPVTGRPTEWAYSGPALAPVILAPGYHSVAHTNLGDMPAADWGTTKAGKPRKRLSQACNQCRDKKIKCDGRQDPKCGQCSKFGRDCKFEASSRHNAKSPKLRTPTNTSPRTTVARPTEVPSPVRRASCSPTDVSSSADALDRTVSKSSAPRDEVTSPDMKQRSSMSDAATPSKRPRLDDELPNDRIQGRLSTASVDVDYMGFTIDADPVTTDRPLTHHYMRSYMDYVNTTAFDIFPRTQFTQWVANETNKSHVDRMVVFAMLAVGSLHSRHKDKLLHRKAFRMIAYQELNAIFDVATLQAVQTSLLLAYLEYAEGNYRRSYHVMQRGIGGVRFLRLGVERATAAGDDNPYGMTGRTFEECCRRTFWGLFISDALKTFINLDPRSLLTDDIFLRLPCASDLFDSGRIPETPLFDPDLRPLSAGQHKMLGNFAYLVQVAHLMSEIRTSAMRQQQTVRFKGTGYSSDGLRGNLEDRLKSWAAQYQHGCEVRGDRNSKVDSPTTTTVRHFAAQPGYYAGHDVMFHYANMELNRSVFHPKLSDRALSEHAQKARQHAVWTLEKAKELVQLHDEEDEFQSAPCGPTAGPAVLAAIDIITAAGKLDGVMMNQSKLMECLYAGLTLLDQLAPCWESARLARELAQKRVTLVFSQASSAIMERKVLFYTTGPISLNMGHEFDLIYGADRKRYLRALHPNEYHSAKPEEILEITSDVPTWPARMSVS